MNFILIDHGRERNGMLIYDLQVVVYTRNYASMTLIPILLRYINLALKFFQSDALCTHAHKTARQWHVV